MNFQPTKSAASAALAARPSTGAAADSSLQAGDRGAPAIPLHMVPTIRNCQGLSTAELAARFGYDPEAIDAVRALGHYSGGDPLASSRLIARDLGSAVVL